MMRLAALALFLMTPLLSLAAGTFSAALSAHLKAVEQRDWNAFDTTLTAGKKLTFVALDGRVSTTKEAFSTADLPPSSRTNLK
jgi:hypothetical protein